MKTRNKALLLMLCAVMLVAASVLGTMAYLTSTDTVENTFTVGSVKITLDEADVKLDGTLNSEKRVQENKYHLLPGHTYIKDPTVTVLKDSEDSYVRMIVTVENFDQLKKALPMKDTTGNTITANAKYYGSDGTFLLQMLCLDEDGNSTWNDKNWKYIPSMENAEKGVYEFRYVDDNGNSVIAKNAEDDTKLLALFTDITVPGELDNEGLAYWGGADDNGVIDENKAVKIVVKAHAIQADGFEMAEEAWSKFN